MNGMSELAAGETHDLIHVGGEVVAVVVPVEEYRQLREALAEQQVNAEFEVAQARRLARREAGETRYVSHQEAGRHLGLPVR
jgi:PHD/YefM family antitoxin component YafN of YafNO toxin-antitoxin module